MRSYELHEDVKVLTQVSGTHSYSPEKNHSQQTWNEKINHTKNRKPKGTPNHQRASPPDDNSMIKRKSPPPCVAREVDPLKVEKAVFILNAKARAFELPVKYEGARNNFPEQRNTSQRNADVNCQLSNSCYDHPNLTPERYGPDQWESYEEGYGDVPSKFQNEQTSALESQLKSKNMRSPESQKADKHESPFHEELQPWYPSEYDYVNEESRSKQDVNSSRQYPLQHAYQRFQVPSREFDTFSYETHLGNFQEKSENCEVDYQAVAPQVRTFSTVPPASCNLLSELDQLHISPQDCRFEVPTSSDQMKRESTKKHTIQESRQILYKAESMYADQMSAKNSTSKSFDSGLSNQARIVCQSPPKSDSAIYSQKQASPVLSSTERNQSRGKGYNSRSHHNASRSSNRSFPVSCPKSSMRHTSRSLGPSHQTTSRKQKKGFSPKRKNVRGLAMGPHNPYPQNEAPRGNYRNAAYRKETASQRNIDVQSKQGFLKGLQMGPHDPSAFVNVDKQMHFQKKRNQRRNISYKIRGS